MSLANLSANSTPEPARWGTRAKPIVGEDLYAAVQWVNSNWQAHKVNGVLLDAFSASAIVAVAEKISAENRTKLFALPVIKVAQVCFRMIERTRQS